MSYKFLLVTICTYAIISTSNGWRRDKVDKRSRHYYNRPPQPEYHTYQPPEGKHIPLGYFTYTPPHVDPFAIHTAQHTEPTKGYVDGPGKVYEPPQEYNQYMPPKTFKESAPKKQYVEPLPYKEPYKEPYSAPKEYVESPKEQVEPHTPYKDPLAYMESPKPPYKESYIDPSFIEPPLSDTTPIYERDKIIYMRPQQQQQQQTPIEYIEQQQQQPLQLQRQYPQQHQNQYPQQQQQQQQQHEQPQQHEQQYPQHPQHPQQQHPQHGKDTQGNKYEEPPKIYEQGDSGIMFAPPAVPKPTYNRYNPTPEPTPVPGPTVIDIALSSPDFTILVAALTQEDCVDPLQGPGPFTVFAPTNDAFISLITALGITAEELLAIPSLKDILLYHVVGGNLFSNDLLMYDYVRTLNGQTISVSGTEDAIVLIDQQGSSSNIIVQDLEATNGVVHAVDTVLLPLFDTVLDIAKSFDDFSILVVAVEATGLAEVLSGPGPFTVFAPTNEAFETLLAALDITIEQLLAIPSLQDIVLYHVIGKFLLTTDLRRLNGNSIETLTSDGQSVRVNVDKSGIIIIIDNQDAGADIGLANVRAKNGVVHVIDSVLLPKFDTVLEIAKSFDEFSILVKVVKETGLDYLLTSPGLFTVFAPPNKAFENLMDALSINLQQLLAIPSLRDIVLYHILGKFLLTTDLAMLNGKHLQTLTSDYQSIEVHVNIEKEIQLIDNQDAIATIGLANVQAKNGVVHVIDIVMLPLFDTVLEIAASFDDFSILVKVVRCAGLEEELLGSGPFTVFAPTNDAFIELMDVLMIDFHDLCAIPSLRDIVLYHVIGAFLTTNDLQYLDETRIETLTSDRQSVRVNADTNQPIMIIDNQDSVADIGLSNVQAKNGIVHVIDSVLLPLFDTVLEVAESFDDYTILVKAVQKAKLEDTLNGPGPFTVFAPNNDAFVILLVHLDITVEDLLNIPSLRDILLYHVVGDYLLTNDFFDEQCPVDQDTCGRSNQLVTLKSDGQSITVSEGEDKINVIDQQQSLTGVASIILANVQAKNGVVHVIDRVLLPLFDTVVEIATSFEKFSILVKAVDEEGLTRFLSSEGPFTVFAPTNEAFAKLMREIHINMDDLLNIPTLRDILLYHIVSDFLLCDDLAANAKHMESITTLKPDYQRLKVVVNEKDIFMRDAQSDYSLITLCDVKAKNGVAHVIDRVLIPLFDSVYQIAASFKDYSILVRLVDHAGITKPLMSDPGPFTVFAPNNMAFERLMYELLIDIDDLLNLPTLKRVLLYHIIGDHLLNNDLESKMYPTLSGQSVLINNANYKMDYDYGFVVKGLSLTDKQNHRSNVLFGNVEANNGVAHVIDRVMIPLFDDIIQIATSFRDYTILVQLVEAAGLTTTLMTTGPFTVFAPNNAAFEKLFYELQLDLHQVMMLPNLRDILWYHILGGYYLAPQLQHEMRTLHDGQTVYINQEMNKYNDHNDNGFAASGISLQDQQHDVRNVIIKNVQARNGVVHVVNRVLMLRWETIMQITASIEWLSILHTGLTMHGLVPYLSGPGPFTAFAPNNAAFRKVAHDIHITMEQLFAIPILRRMLLYHISPGYILAPDFRTQPYPTEIGQPRQIIVDGYRPVQGFRIDGIGHIDQQDDPSNILIGNVEAKNGVAYVLNEALILKFDSVFEIGAIISDYSIVIALAMHAGMQHMLMFDGPFTLFAPNNMAFFVLMWELLMDFEDLFNLPNLRDVLYYHILPAHLLSCNLGPSVRSLNGQFVHFHQDIIDDCHGYAIENMVVQDQQQDPAHILFGNVQAFNGVVHVVQRVLVLRFDSVFQIATLLKDYTIVVDLLMRVGLDELLVSPGHFTVFAPRNEAFYKLMEELRITMDDIYNMPLLREVLLYHVMYGYLLSYDLGPGSYETINEFLVPQYVHISRPHEYNTGFYGFAVRGIEVQDEQMRDAYTLLGNLEAYNGVAHVVDRVMIPMFDTVIQIAEQIPADYSMLVELAMAGGIYDQLNDPLHGPFTVFGPDNRAFLQLMEEIHITWEDLLTTPILTKVLLYHINGLYLFTTDLVNGELITLSDNTVGVDVYNYDGYRGGFDVVGPFFIDGQLDESHMYIGNVQAHNGIVHIVDRVMIPLFDNIMQIATAFKDYSILVTLVEAAGLTNMLVIDPGPFTVFAPNNAAFEKLMAELHITLEDLIAMPRLKDILLYHIMPARLLSADLCTGTYEMMNGQTIEIVNTNLCSCQPIPATEDEDEEGVTTNRRGYRDSRRRMQNDLENAGHFGEYNDNNLNDINDPNINANRYNDIDFDETYNPDDIFTFNEFDNREDDNINVEDRPFYDIPNNPGEYNYTLWAIPEFPINNSNFSRPESNHPPINPPPPIYYGESGEVIVGGETEYICDYGFYVNGIQIIDRQEMIILPIFGNVEGENGVVHVIDRVMIPMFDSVVDIAVQFEDYDILVQLADAADLVPTLTGPGPLTVFAPNNYAFYQLMEELNININDLINLPILRDVLLYHISGAYLFTTDLSTGSVPVLNGDYIEVNSDFYAGYRDGYAVEGIFNVDGQHDMSNLFIGNIKSYNGIVHVIDRVMVLLFDSIVQIATSFDDYSILVTLVQAADMTEFYSTTSPLTVFAPNNYAFYKLMDKLMIDIDDLINLPILRDVLLYHTIGSYLLAERLVTANYTSLQGQTLFVDPSDYRPRHEYGFGVIGITTTDKQDTTAWTQLGNVEAQNGVVHVIDEVMLPLFDSVVQIATLFEDYSILVAALVKAGLVDTLLGPGPFTVFAPNNDAFNALMDALGITIDDLLNIPSLSDILLYHVVGDWLLERDLAARSGTVLTTVNTQTVQINANNNGVSLIDQQRKTANIIISDIRAKNGVVHVIDAVMLPLFESVVAIGQSLDAFSILVAALDKAGLVDALKAPGPFTVFAPTNDAFNKLLTELGITIDDLLNLTNLSEILLYHVLGGNHIFTYNDLLGFGIYDGIDVVTLNGATIRVEVEGSNVKIVDKSSRIANVIIHDLFAKNGVVHVIDNVLLPFDTSTS